MTWKQYFVTPWADSLEQEEKVGGNFTRIIIDFCQVLFYKV